MSQSWDLKTLVGKRYNWDTKTYEKIIEVKKEIVSQEEKQDVKNEVKKVEEVEKKWDKKLSKNESKSIDKNEDRLILEAEKEYKEALAYIKDMVAPAFMKIYPDKVRINNVFAKTFFVYAYPNFLEGNWLSPIINWDTKFDMSLFVYPIDSAYIQKYLRKRLTQLNSERSINAEKGLVNDPAINAQIQDVEELREKLTRGQEKYFHLGLYITLYAENEDKLNKIWKDVETILAWRNVLQKQSFLRAEQGFISTWPFARDELWVYRNMSTWGLSTTFPFSSSTLTHDDWILYWVNTHNNSLILYDRFRSENANMCVFAKSWGWKSFAVKLEILRSLMMWTDVIVVDPENEYKALVDTVWGSYLDVSLNSTQRINPFDLPLALKDKDLKSWDLLRDAIINLLWLMNLMLWKLTSREESIVERAIITTYNLKWITLEDDSVEGKEIPTMQDFYDVIETMDGWDDLARRLEKYTTWIFSWIFNKHTNIDLKEWLQVFSVRDLDDILRPTAMYIILNHIWNKVRSENKKRMLVIDEAWNIMQHADSAKFLFWLVKRARKYNLWVTTITQDVEDFIGSSYGKPIVTNSSIQLLLKQSPASLDALQNIFKITDQEKYILLNSSVWQGLFFAWSEHVWIQVIASYYEEQIVSTNPNR
jgi:conjugal transfer ATP-binding protein TraC